MKLNQPTNKQNIYQYINHLFKIGNGRSIYLFKNKYPEYIKIVL